MRRSLLVMYDISSPKRLRKVHRLLRGYGDPVQLSVFYCELSHRDLVELEGYLRQVIHSRCDQVLIADLGPARGRGLESMKTLGRQYSPPERTAVIV